MRFAASPVAGFSPEQSALLRVFGSAPNSYGAGVLPLLQAQNWQDDADLSRVYLAWGSFAYSREHSGTPATELFAHRLASVSLALHNQDNREHDIFDSDDYLQYHGGMIATIRHLRGRAPLAYIGDSQDPEQPQVRTLRAEVLRVFRSRVMNPLWLKRIEQHGYKGALELSATVDYLFGYDATAHTMQDWMYEQLAQTYALDPDRQAFFEQANPWALHDITERLLEAASRGQWAQPDPATLAALQQQYLAQESTLEARAEGDEQP